MNQTILILTLCLGGGHETKPRPSRAQYQHANQRIMQRYRENPTGFSPHFMKSDPASHPAKFLSHIGQSSALEAQKLGIEKDKEYNLRMSKNKMPIVLQLQVQYKGN